MRILLTGKDGQLGWELRRQLERDFEVLAIGREEIDFLDTKFFASAIRSLPRLNLIVNAAAYTQIDRAPQEPFVAEAVNSEAVATLAAEADRRGIPMIHFSTSRVFNGQRRTRPYREEDMPNPISLYGSTKLAGELRLRSILEKHLIFRLSGLYGSHHRNFFTEVWARNRKGIAARVSDNQVISPNWSPLVAEAVADAIQQLFWGENIPWGTYHLSGSGSTTPYAFAQLICERINAVWGGNMPLPIPVHSQKCGSLAKRPRYSVLDSARFRTVFQCTLPNWQEQFLHFFGGITPRRVHLKQIESVLDSHAVFDYVYDVIFAQLQMPEILFESADEGILTELIESAASDHPEAVDPVVIISLLARIIAIINTIKADKNR